MSGFARFFKLLFELTTEDTESTDKKLTTEYTDGTVKGNVNYLRKTLATRFPPRDYRLSSR